MNRSSAELAQRVIKVQLDNESLTCCILLAICVDSEDQNARKCRFILVLGGLKYHKVVSHYFLKGLKYIFNQVTIAA